MDPMEITPDRVRALLKHGEGQTVEFKLRMPPEEVAERLIVAFANTQGGVLLLGVGEEKGAPCLRGFHPREVTSAITQLRDIANKVLEGVPWRVGSVDVDSRSVVYLTVGMAPREQRPVTTLQGHVLVRHGDALQESAGALQSYFFDAFGKTATKPKHGTVSVFVAMSFREQQEPALVDYFRAMQRAARRSKTRIEIKRIDLEEGDYEISQKIMDEVDQADAVIADFTLSPANVYFEVGYARGRRKAIIQVARKETPLEFDTRNWRTRFYRNATELEEMLVAAFDALGEPERWQTST
jgi:nucleoside 2-deoxyribosyltransferase